MQSGANFLVLDEPTNHLDIDSVEMLEDAIERFDGTVVFSSHDRYFLDRIADRTLEVATARRRLRGRLLQLVCPHRRARPQIAPRPPENSELEST